MAKTKLSRNNPPKRADYPSDAAYKSAMATHSQRYPTPKDGAYNYNRTKQYRKGKWHDVNVIHKGQKAKKGGKTVYADGKGNWRLLSGVDVVGSRQSEGAIVGTYTKKPEQSRGPKVLPTIKKNKTNNTSTPKPTSKTSNVHSDTKARQAKKQAATDRQIRVNAKLANTRAELARRAELKKKNNQSPRTAETASAKPPVQTSRQPTTTTSAPTKKSTASTYKAHGSALHVGRYEKLADHRAAVKAREAKESGSKVSQAAKSNTKPKTTGPSKNDVQRLTGGSTPKQGAEASAAIKRLKKKTVKQRLGKTVPTSKIPPTNAPASVMRKYLADLEAGRLTR